MFFHMQLRKVIKGSRFFFFLELVFIPLEVWYHGIKKAVQGGNYGTPNHGAFDACF